MQLSDYHKMIHNIKNKNIFRKIGFKIGLLKIDDNLKPPKPLKISDHEPHKIAVENLEKAKIEVLDFEREMELIDIEPLPQIENKPEPKIEKSHNYIIDIEPVITPPSEDFATAQELKELNSAAEQEFKDMEQKLEEERPNPSDNSPSLF